MAFTRSFFSPDVCWQLRLNTGVESASVRAAISDRLRRHHIKKQVGKKMQIFRENTAVISDRRRSRNTWTSVCRRTNQFLLLTVLTGVTDLYGKPEA